MPRPAGGKVGRDDLARRTGQPVTGAATDDTGTGGDRAGPAQAPAEGAPAEGAPAGGAADGAGDRPPDGDGPNDEDHSGDDRALSGERRRFLTELGLPALGVTFGVTVVSTYAPVLIGAKSSPLVVGLVVGGEGFFGLFVPIVAGTLSDRTSRTVADRFRALLVTAPLAALGLLVLAVLGGIPAVAVGAAVYFAAHFAYLAPYQALYADVVPDAESGRSRSFESVWRLIGAGSALIAGGFLVEAWQPSPFLVAAVLVVGSTLLAWRLLRGHADDPVRESEAGFGELRETLRELLAIRDIRLLVVANALWNATLAGMRAFVVLFFTMGLHRSPSFVSGVVFPLVAVGLAISAPLAGKLADRYGHVRVLTVAVPVYGVGLVLPGIWQSAWVLGLVPVVSAAAATVMTIPYAALMRRMPEENHGAASGLFTLARGAGSLAGPLVAGGAILGLQHVLSGTRGYAAMWFVIGGATLATLPLLTRIGRDGEAD